MQARTGRVSVPSMNPAAHTETPIRERADHRGDPAGARSPQRRRRGRLTSVLLALGSVAMLAGCATASAAPTPTPTPTSLIAGLFSSEDEALNAAREVYLQYAALSEALSADPTMDTAQLQAITSPGLFDYEVRSAALLAETGVRFTGSMSYFNFALYDFGPNTVSFSMCGDVSGVRMINANGVDVSDDTKSQKAPMQATVLFGANSPIVSTVDGSEIPSCD